MKECLSCGRHCICGDGPDYAQAPGKTVCISFFGGNTIWLTGVRRIEAYSLWNSVMLFGFTLPPEGMQLTSVKRVEVSG